MAYSFDNLVYYSSLAIFIVSFICVFAYEYLSSRSIVSDNKESRAADYLSRKDRKYKQQQSDKFGTT
jgi:hypothetical protein